MPLRWNIANSEMGKIRDADSKSEDNCCDMFISAVGMAVLRRETGGYNHSLDAYELTQELAEDIMSEWLKDTKSEQEEKEIKNVMMKAEKGDQVYVKGYLAEYSHSNEEFKRGTSISRDDSGNGACETIYVTSFKILKKANFAWRLVNNFSKGVILVCMVFLIFFFVKNP